MNTSPAHLLRRASVALALLGSAACASAAKGHGATEPPPPGTDHRAAAELAAAGERTDLTSHGLPLTIHLPECAKVVEPLVKIADNAHDLMLICDLSDTDAMNGKQAFAIQLGPAKGKIGRDEIAKDPAFIRFTKSERGLLEFESKIFGEVRRDFMVRATKGGTEYACYPVAGTTDEKLFAAEKESCLSITEKASEPEPPPQAPTPNKK